MTQADTQNASIGILLSTTEQTVKAGQVVGITPAPALSTIINGTANQITVTPGLLGSVTLSTPQDIAAISSPTFVDVKLTGLTASDPVVTDGAKNLASLAYTGVGSFRANLALEPTNSPTFVGLTLSGLTASEPVVSDGAKALASVTYAAFKTSLAIAQADVSGLTTASSPTFTGLTLSGLTASEPIVTDGAKALASVTYAAFKASLAIAQADVSGLTTASSPTFTGLTLSGLTASKAVVSDAGKALVSLDYTGATSLRKNLALETSDSPAFTGLTCDTSVFVVDATNNRTGFGIAAPSAVTHISVDGSTPDASLFSSADNLLMTNSGGQTSIRMISADNVTATTATSLNLTRTRGTLAAPVAPSSGDSLVNVNAQTYNAGARVIVGSIQFQTDGAAGATYVPGRILFMTASSTGAATERLRIDSAGLFTFSGALLFGSLGARVAGDKYLIVDASGNVHKSAIGPAS